MNTFTNVFVGAQRLRAAARMESTLIVGGHEGSRHLPVVPLANGIAVWVPDPCWVRKLAGGGQDEILASGVGRSSHLRCCLVAAVR